MRRKQIQHHIDALIALLLFGVFAACVLAVLLTGADAYRRLTLRDQAAYERRACTQYIATKVRQADAGGSVAVTDIEGTPALVLGAGEEYVTYIYCHGGWLRELYAWAEEPAAPEDGHELVAAEGLSLSLEDGLLTVRVAGTGGGEDTLLLSLRSGEGAAS
ncbi:MAG: DUF4860 domain-containing protein [Clostridiales bacterium]|nr:DUF4860 domain-containing protein [Clostridiales bacterium]